MSSSDSPTSRGGGSGAGYSKRSLLDKLGIKAGMRVCFIDDPPGYRALLGPLPDEVVVSATLRGKKDFIHFFTDRESRLASRLPALRRALRPAGLLWVSWPKKSSGVETDVTEGVVRRLALDGGLVDVKVCAVDETWSGLKLVIPVAQRPGAD